MPINRISSRLSDLRKNALRRQRIGIAFAFV
jgi:hypothetical protein